MKTKNPWMKKSMAGIDVFSMLNLALVSIGLYFLATKAGSFLARISMPKHED